MLPSPLLALRVLVWLQVWLLAAAAVAAVVLAALLLPSLPHDDQGEFAGLGRDLFHLALAGAAVTAIPALVLGGAARAVRDAGGAGAVVGVAVILLVEAAVTIVALWSVARVGAAGPVVLAVTTVPAVLLALTPSSLRWIRRSWARPAARRASRA